MLWLTGCSNEWTREAATRPDLGVLGTPAGGTIAQRHLYAGGWAVDNACFAEAPIPPITYPHLRCEDEWLRTMTATACHVRYEQPHTHRVIDMLGQLDPAGCRWVTLPDIVGDYRASWERSAIYVAKVGGAGWPIGLVMQDGLESDQFVWRSMISAVQHYGGALFIGGSTEWKLGPACAQLVTEAKAAGCWVHMGRVNTLGRLQYAKTIGCDSADGTCARFGPVAVATMLDYLDRVNRPSLF